VFWHPGREGSCDNLRVRRGGGNSGSGVIVRVNIFLRNYSNAKHHAGTFRCHREVWCCFDSSERVPLTRGPDSGLRQMFCRFRDVAYFRDKRSWGKTSPSQRSENSGGFEGVRENSSFAPLGLASFSSFPPTPYGVGCILSPLRGYNSLPKTPAAKSRSVNP
jgi:hypothetical protein